MSFIKENISILRGILLALLVVAIVGPWVYTDRVNVPAEWPCGDPFVRIDEDFCGMPLLGIAVLSTYVFGFLQFLWGLLIGGIELAVLDINFLYTAVYILLIILPVLTSFLLLLRTESIGLRLLHALALVLAAGVLGVWVSIMSGPGNRILWGGQLYIGVIVLLLALEGLALVKGRRFNQGV